MGSLKAVVFFSLHLSGTVALFRSRPESLDNWLASTDVEAASDLEKGDPSKVPLCKTYLTKGKSWSKFFRSGKGCINNLDRKRLQNKEHQVDPNLDPIRASILQRIHQMDNPVERSAENWTWTDHSQKPSPPCGEACNTDVEIPLVTDPKNEGTGYGDKSLVHYATMKWYDIFDEASMNDDTDFNVPDWYLDRNPHMWDASYEKSTLIRNAKQQAISHDLTKLLEKTEIHLWAAAVMDEDKQKLKTKEEQAFRKKNLDLTWFSQADKNFIYMRAWGSMLSSFGGSLYDQTNILEQFEDMKSAKSLNPLKLSDEDTDAMLEGWLGRQYTGNWNAWMWLSTNLMMRAISSGEVGKCVSRGCKPKPKPPEFNSLDQLFEFGGVAGFVAIDTEDGYQNGCISPKRLIEKLTKVPGLANLRFLLKDEYMGEAINQLDFSKDGRMFYPQYLIGVAVLIHASIEATSHAAGLGPMDGVLSAKELIEGFRNQLGVSVTDDEFMYYYNKVLEYDFVGETSKEVERKKKRGIGIKELLVLVLAMWDGSVSRPIYEYDRMMAWDTLETAANSRVLDYGGWHLIIGCMYDIMASWHDLIEAYMSKDAEAVKDAWSTMVGSISNYGMWTNNALGIIKAGTPSSYEDVDALLKNSISWIPTDQFVKAHKEDAAPTPKYYNGMKYVPHSDLLPVGCGMYCSADEERRKANAFVSTPYTYLHMLPTLPIYMGDMTLWDTKAPKREYFPSTMSEGIAYKRLIALRWMTWGLTVMHIANVREFYLDWTKYTKFPEEGSMDQRDSNHIYRLWTSFQLLWYQTWLKGAESDYKAMKQGKTARFTKKGLLRSTNLATLPKKQATLPQSKLGQPQGAMPTLPQQALSPLASDPIKLATTPLDAGATPAFLEVPDFHAHVVQMISPSNGTTPKLMSPALKYEWQFWRMGLRYMASWHTILSCSYDLASNIRGVQLAAKKVSLLVANFGDTCEWLSASLEAYSEAQNNLLISLTNFGTWVSYHIPTTLIGYPAQVREYAVHHGRKPIARSKERAMLWTFMWSNIYYIIGTQITWTPTPMLGKEYAKNLGKETITGKKLSKKIAGLVPDTMLMPNADGQITGPLETTMPLTATKTYAKHLDDGIECSGGEVFGRIGDFAEMATYDVVGAMHQALSTGEESRPNHPGATNRLQKALDWLYKGGYDAAKPPVCTHKVPKKMMRKYVEAQISRMMPPPTGAANLPPWAPAYKPEVDNLMSDLWMVPRPGEAEKNMEDPSSASAPITRYPSAVLEVGFAAAMQPLGTGFMSMNPISTNMFPSITQPVALASTP